MSMDDYIPPSEKTQKMIDDFVEKYPESSFGPAHILMDDGNTMDEDLQSCIRNCHSWIERGEGDKKEIEDTIIFLQELLKIPEDDR